MSKNLSITNVRPMNVDGPVDIRIENGVVASVTPHGEASDNASSKLDGEGALVFPAFIYAHTHIDKTLLGMSWHRHDVGPSLMDKIVNECELIKNLQLDSHERSMEQVRQSLARGTTAIRTFSDINTE
jgi:cytosine/adenosine deaminase-related metal-dependent hydrolase